MGGPQACHKDDFSAFWGERLQPEVQARMKLFQAAYQSRINFQETLCIWMKIGDTKGEEGRFL